MIRTSQVIFVIVSLSLFILASPTSSAPKPNNAQLEDLARIIYAEARGEPYLGQIAVGAVVLNRVKNANFPNTIKQVLYEELAFQPIENNQFYNRPNDSAYRAAREALNGRDPTGGALYFYNPSKISAHNWIWSRKVITKIGSHSFAL